MPTEIIMRATCERCYTKIEETDFTEESLPKGWRIVKVESIPNEPTYGGRLLCPGCVRYFDNFMNELKPKEPRKARKDKGTKRSPSIDGMIVLTPMGDPNFEIPVDLAPEATVKKNLTVQRSEDKPVDTNADIFSTFEIKTPELGKDGQYIFRMGGQEVKSKTLVAGVETLLALCGIMGDLGEYPSSPQLQQVKNILFSVEHLE